MDRSTLRVVGGLHQQEKAHVAHRNVTAMTDIADAAPLEGADALASARRCAAPRSRPRSSAS